MPSSSWSSSIEAIDQLAPPVPVAAPHRVLDEYIRRTTALTGQGRAALLVASIAEGDATVMAAATRSLGVEPSGLDEGERAGLISFAGGAPAFDTRWPALAPTGRPRPMNAAGHTSRSLMRCPPSMSTARRGT